MFPEAASDSIRFILRDAAHDLEEVIEVKGRATFPGLDTVTKAYCWDYLFALVQNGNKCRMTCSELLASLTFWAFQYFKLPFWR